MSALLLELDPALVLAEAARLSETGATPEDWETFNTVHGNGWIYFIQAGDDGPVKIGFARSLHARLENLQVANAARLHVRLVLWGTQEDERGIQQQFSFARLRGEWFRWCPDIADYVRSLYEAEDISEALA